MRKLFLVLCIPFLFSCVDDDNPDSITKEPFKVSAGNDFFKNYNDAYVIIHDLAGNPLQFKQIKGGETIEFQVDKSKKHHLTVYKTDDSSGKQQSFITTKLNVDLSKDTVLMVNYNNPGETEYAPNLIGNFKVNFTNSEPLISLLSARGYNSEFIYWAKSITPKMKLFSNVNKYLAVAATESGHSRYQFIDNPEINNTYNLKFEDMLEFDHIIKLPVSEYESLFYTITSMNPESSKGSTDFIIKPDSWSFKPKEYYEIGYINEVENYKTFVHGKKNPNSKTTFGYLKQGSISDKIEIIDIDEIQIVKPLITHFEIGTKVENAIYVTTFSSPLSFLPYPQNQFLQWTVSSGTSTKYSLDLPEELKSSNNLIANLDDLLITSQGIWKYLQEEKTSDIGLLFEYTMIKQDFNN